MESFNLLSCLSVCIWRKRLINNRIKASIQWYQRPRTASGVLFFHQCFIRLDIWVTSYTENHYKNNYQQPIVNKTLKGQWTMSHILQVRPDTNLFTMWPWHSPFPLWKVFHVKISSLEQKISTWTFCFLFICLWKSQLLSLWLG